jgi:polysaccharide export outer membrane protein
MRHGRRARLIAGLGTTLGLWAAGAGCQSAATRSASARGEVVSVGAPVALAEPAPPGWTARAASPAAEVAWHTAPESSGGVQSAGFIPSDAQSDGNLTGPPLAPVPDPEKAQPPEGKKPDAKKDAPELPAPQPLPPGPPLVPVPVGHPSVPDVPRELAKQPLPTYVIEPPDILLVEAVPREGPLKNDQQIRGQHLVRMDGTIGLGIYGSAFVGGLTIEQAREAIAEQIRKRVKNFDIRDLNVDVLAYNSKFYYVVTDGGGYGEQVYPFPITGSETVLDALGRINGLPPVADKRKVWVARRGPGEAGHVMPVDWCGIVQRGATSTNYQLMPGDRIYVKADHWISTDAWIGKRLSPIERIFGATLLGSQTVNSLRTNPNHSGGTTGGQ